MEKPAEIIRMELHARGFTEREVALTVCRRDAPQMELQYVRCAAARAHKFFVLAVVSGNIAAYIATHHDSHIF
jgi:hypothetical protein